MELIYQLFPSRTKTRQLPGNSPSCLAHVAPTELCTANIICPSTETEEIRKPQRVYIFTHRITKSKVWPTACLHEQRHHHLSPCIRNEGGSQSPILVPPQKPREPKFWGVLNTCKSWLSVQPALLFQQAPSSKTQSLLAAHSSKPLQIGNATPTLLF